jgi:hypothetical protein
MAKGNLAKEQINARIQAAFGEDYIGVFDKKIYVYADDGGEKVQIAIAMTCPKTEVAAGQSQNTTEPASVMPVTLNPAVTPEEEKAALEALYAKLGF